MTRRSSRRVRATILALAAIAVLWIGSTRLLLWQWPHELARSRGHHTGGLTELFISSGDTTRFVLWMGNASIGFLHRAMDSPKATLRGKIHCGWVLCQLDDWSRFDVFFTGLHSRDLRIRYIAGVRMWDFPQQCLQHPHDLAAAAGTWQHEDFWTAFGVYAEQFAAVGGEGGYPVNQ